MDDEQVESPAPKRKRQRVREVADMHAFASRVITAIGKRAVLGDTESARALSDLGDWVDTQLRVAVKALRAEPWEYSWSDVGSVLGVTKQAAQQRFGHRAGSTTSRS